MSDELRPAEIVMPRHTGGVIDHRCEHEGCTAWASFGYSRTKQETRWFCHEHRDDGEAYLGR
jgi:hypothetical protein